VSLRFWSLNQREWFVGWVRGGAAWATVWFRMSLWAWKTFRRVWCGVREWWRSIGLVVGGDMMRAGVLCSLLAVY
jgi:hypothetical protein